MTSETLYFIFFLNFFEVIWLHWSIYSVCQSLDVVVLALQPFYIDTIFMQ